MQGQAATDRAHHTPANTGHMCRELPTLLCALAGNVANVTASQLSHLDIAIENGKKSNPDCPTNQVKIYFFKFFFFFSSKQFTLTSTAELPGQPKKSFQKDNIILCQSQSLAHVRTISSCQNERQRNFTTFFVSNETYSCNKTD